MMRRFAVAVTLLLLLPAAARAEWHLREAAIMGTRIAAEVWHDDAVAGEERFDESDFIDVVARCHFHQIASGRNLAFVRHLACGRNVALFHNRDGTAHKVHIAVGAS